MLERMIKVSNDFAVPETDRFMGWVFRYAPLVFLSFATHPLGGKEGGENYVILQHVGVIPTIEALKITAEVNRRFRRGELPEAQIIDYNPEDPICDLTVEETTKRGKERGF